MYMYTTPDGCRSFGHVSVCVYACVCANIICIYIHNIYIYIYIILVHTNTHPNDLHPSGVTPLGHYISIYTYIYTHIYGTTSAHIYIYTHTHIHIYIYIHINTITHLLFTHPCQCTRGFRGPLPRHRSPRTTAKRHVPRAAAARTARR